jgi:hypothetical protein
MGITKTADGRYQVGKGIADAHNYTGALGKRDMVIQYTEDGVTAQSMDYLNFLKDYAEHHADIGELIKPSDVSIWIAKDDKLTAVEADDISYDDGTFTLSSITYDGTDWTFGEPTPGGGGGGEPLFKQYGGTIPLVATSTGTVDFVIDPSQSEQVAPIVFNGPFYTWTCDSISFGGNTYERSTNSSKWQSVGNSLYFDGYSYAVLLETQGSSWRIEATNLDNIPASTPVTFNNIVIAVSQTEDAAMLMNSGSITSVSGN